MTRKELETELANLFDVAISDSIDIDWSTTDGARACVKALLDDHVLLAALAALGDAA